MPYPSRLKFQPTHSTQALAHLRDCICFSALSAGSKPIGPSDPCPFSYIFSFDNLSSARKNCALALYSEVKPKNYQKVCQFACWRKAIEVEVAALE